MKNSQHNLTHKKSNGIRTRNSIGLHGDFIRKNKNKNHHLLFGQLMLFVFLYKQQTTNNKQQATNNKGKYNLLRFIV